MDPDTDHVVISHFCALCSNGCFCLARGDPTKCWESVHALTMSALLLRIVWLLAFVRASDGAAKVKRVKAGKSYKTHDAVHIVVNKVG
jgi:hypothetical protein